MRELRSVTLLATAFLVCRPAAAPPAPAATYSQTYIIFIKGVPSGTETATEEPEPTGNLISSSASEIVLSDGIETKRMAFVTKLQLAKGSYAPISYTYRYTSGTAGDGYEVTIRNGQATRILTRNGRSSESTLMLDPSAVIIDFSVYHQYDYLIRKYDLKKGGRQSFPNFIPLIAADIPLMVTRLEDSRLEHPRGVLPVRNFRVEFSSLWSALLATDKDGRLVRLLVREQDLEVLRSDVAPEMPPQGPAKPPQF